jgi:hypothetical protein
VPACFKDLKFCHVTILTNFQFQILLCPSVSPPGEIEAAGNGSGSRIVDARETFSTLAEMGRLLNTALDTETIAICVRL